VELSRRRMTQRVASRLAGGSPSGLRNRVFHTETAPSKSQNPSAKIASATSCRS
jgi:hypothetical protein